MYSAIVGAATDSGGSRMTSLPELLKLLLRGCHLESLLHLTLVMSMVDNWVSGSPIRSVQGIDMVG
jgi:hypothetical protein